MSPSVLPSIPKLSDYGISPSRGFLPSHSPINRLPDPYYNKWEDIASNLQALVLSRRLRHIVDQLPVLSTIGLEQDAEWRRAYSILCFIAHAYIWGGDQPSDRLPEAISIPLLQISHRLELPPVATYSAVCLWNFRPIFNDQDIDDIENLATLNTFTGSLDESWFYLVSVAIEARGAPIISSMLSAMGAAQRGEHEEVTERLRDFAECLTDLTAILQRMHERCDPTIFYNRIRPFLAGSKNMAEAGLPLGVLYEDGSGSEEYRQYSGGSNAQSSLIQFFDIVLGIEHRPTGEKRESSGLAPPNNFITEMRKYMPGPHARFLEDTELASNIREFVESNRQNTSLSVAYDACLAMLAAFRDKHISIVTRYIIIPAKEVQSRNRHTSVRNIATPAQRENTSNNKRFTGTGGTSLIPFLKQARDETSAPAVNEWVKQILGKQRKLDPFSIKPTTHEETTIKVTGLAGTWSMDMESCGGGGLCHY